MSTWGGEGIGDAMWKGIDVILRDRANKQAQANADREFELKRQAAENAQANADRTFEAGREDAARAQKNSEADRALRQKIADNAQVNAEREFGLKQDEMALKGDVANAELGLKQDEMAISREAQDWQNRLNAERERQFKLANDALDMEWQKKKEQEEAKKASGRSQLAMAMYRVTGGGGEEKTITIKDEKGNPVQKTVKVLPAEQRQQIFGTDGYFKDVQNVISYKDENGKSIVALVRPDGSMQQFTPEQQYDILRDGVGKDFADNAMRATSEEIDLGMFTKKEQAKAEAQEKARLASDPYGFKRRSDADVAILRSDDATQQQRDFALQDLMAIAQEQKDIQSRRANPNGNVSGGIGATRASLEAERKKLMLQKQKRIQPLGVNVKSASAEADGSSQPKGNTSVQKQETASRETPTTKTDEFVDDAERAAIKKYKEIHPENASDIDKNPERYEKQIRSIARGMTGDKGYKVSGDKRREKAAAEEKLRKQAEREAMIASSSTDEGVIKKARAMYGSLYDKAKNMSLENDEGDADATRKYFAELVKKYNKENGVVTDDYWHSARNAFGDYNISYLLSDVFGDDAGQYFGDRGYRARAQRRIKKSRED